MEEKIQHLIVTNWWIIHGGLNVEFTLKEHKFNRIYLRACEYEKGNMIRVFFTCQNNTLNPMPLDVYLHCDSLQKKII